MILDTWLKEYNTSAFARVVTKDWNPHINLQLIWDTCLCPRLLLDIIRSQKVAFIEIKRSEKSEAIFLTSFLFKPSVVGLEFILVNHKSLEMRTAIRLLKSVCSDTDDAHACRFIRSRVDYPFEGL